MVDEVAVKYLDELVDTLDIPESYYRRAADRHRSLGEWLCRPESTLSSLNPHVTPQGSFRYGTVNRPLNSAGEYDLDNVVTMELAKTATTQKRLKEWFGVELKAYARAHNMTSPLEEMHRCWRLHYSDEVAFHLDSLPCVTEEDRIIKAISARNVPMALASRAVAITDRRHPMYDQISDLWLSSNPRGFARWFEERVKVWALPRMRKLVEQRLFASVEDVPSYQWKTPLQRVIQLLKRHRDVMFFESPDRAPISMIITNLAAQAYDGEADIWTALKNIVAKMPAFVKNDYPRIPNPADPAEDYADKWRKDPELEQNFWTWHSQVEADVKRIPALLHEQKLDSGARKMFRIDLTEAQLKKLAPSASNRATGTIVTAPSVVISNPPRPWGRFAD